MSDFLINAGLILTYIMIAVAALAAIVYPLMFMAKNPSKGKNALMGVGGLVLICIVSYIIASGDIMNFPGSEKFGMTEGSTKRVGMGLITFYILSIGVIAVLTKPVDFDAQDRRPVDIVCLVIGPQNADSDHLKCVSSVARSLREVAICDQLRAAKTPHELLGYLGNASDVAA